MPSEAQRFGIVLRARHPLVTVVSAEEDHILEAVIAAALTARRRVHTWTIVRGVYEGSFETDVEPEAGTVQPGAALRWCWQAGAGRVFVFCDLLPHLGNEVVLRALRELVQRCRELGSTVVLVDSRDGLPDPLAGEAVLFAPAPPDDAEIQALVRATFDALKADAPVRVELAPEQARAALRALRGLGRSAIRRLVADAVAENGRFDAAAVERLTTARAKLLGRGSLLERVEVGSDDVAGAVNLKRWLELRRPLLDQADAIDPPRGVLLLGVPGSGKSLCAKAVARWWGRPLLRLDVGSLYDRYVGESERRLREALVQAEAMAPAVLWVDEIEKAFASAASQSTDGGLSQRMFGCLLTWMQERRAPVFLVATANDLQALPPELLRKGRFDEIFFVDLPGPAVRAEIARVHLAKRRLDPAAFDGAAIAAASEGCTGADLEAAIASALLEARHAGRDLTTADILAALAASAPLARLMRERIQLLRHWARERCRFVDEPEV